MIAQRVCIDCPTSIVIGTRCPSCAAKRLARVVELRNDHGQRCTCLSCVVARSEARLGG